MYGGGGVNGTPLYFYIHCRLWEGILSGQPMSEEEVCQMIMCQYPEEEFGEGGQQLHQDVPDAEVGQPTLQSQGHL